MSKIINRFHFVSLFVVVVLALSGCGGKTGPSPNSWDIVIADSDGNVGQFSSIAVDSNGKAHIAYFEWTKDEQIGEEAVPYGNLKYADNVNGSWQTVTLDMGAGATPRIFVDGNDKVHIVHTKLGASDIPSILDLKYTTNKSGSWETVSIGSGVVKGADASIAVDANGKVHISCRNEEGIGSPEGGQGGLRYITDASGEWTWYDVDTSSTAGNDGDIAVDGDGNVHISYLDKNAGLKYATNSGGAWVVEVIDNIPHVGWNTSIAVDSNDKVHISYSDPSPILDQPGNGYLKYATNASGEWVIQVVDDKDAGFFTGIDVDSQDNVHIAYYTWDGSRGRLKYATNASGSWVIETVDEDGAVGLYCAIALDSQDHPHISYYDYIKQDLKYAMKGNSPEPPAPVTPKLGISVLPKGQMAEWNDASFTNAFQKAREGGFTVAVWRHQWGELEPTLGSYQWGDLDYEVWKTDQQGMEYSLVVEVIHTNSLGQYPADISFTTFDSPAFVESFGNFVQALLQRYPGKIHYLWLGNEVDSYLHEHPDQIMPFVNLYREMEGQIKSIDSDIVVGIVGAYHLARSNGEIPMLQSFAEEGDAIALTLYMEDDDASPDVSETQSYFEELMSHFSGKQVAIIETSWSSGGFRGSEQTQADYVRELAQVLKTHRERFLFFSWFILYDLPQDLNRQIAVSFGVCPEQPPDPPWCTEFLSWQGSLAMLRNDGSEKPAWGVWKEEIGGVSDRSPRLTLWLAKKEELIAHESAGYDLVMTAWFEPAEAQAIRARRLSAKLLAGLTHTWIWDNPEWLNFLITVANGGDPNGSLQITDDMYLMFDDDGDGILDRRCSLPGWTGIYAMDPRHPGWRQLILAFYETVAAQPQHDGVIVDMVDAYPFCEGAWSGGVATPLDAATWVAAQDELLGLIREQVPPEKWVFANAGRDFPPGSPFPQHLNGYLLENFLGEWGLPLKEGLASAQRALETTTSPHVVVFAVDTDDTGTIDWPRFRMGLVASLLMDNTYFAFDYGPRDHGGVSGWWFPQYYDVVLGEPLGPYSLNQGVYRRDFELGTVVASPEYSTTVSFAALHRDIATGSVGIEFTIPQGDARLFVAVVETASHVYLPLVIKNYGEQGAPLVLSGLSLQVK